MRPPRGYDSSDKPLHHQFTYETGLTTHGTVNNRIIATLLRTSKISVDPSTIEVHRKNTSFAVDGGPLVCYDSIIPEIEIVKSYMMDYGAIQTSKLPALKLHLLKIFGHHKDSWDAIDPLSSSTPQTILEVTKDDTNEDVIPTFNGNDLPDAGNQPLSTVTGAEVFGDYGLTTDAKLEGVSAILSGLDDAIKYKVIANKLKSMTRHLRGPTLHPSKPLWTSYEKRFTPPQVQFADEDLFYAEMVELTGKSKEGSPLNPNISTTDISHVYVKYHVSFNEWNKDFDQRRM